MNKSDLDAIERRLGGVSDLQSAFDLAAVIKACFPASDGYNCYFHIEQLPNDTWTAGFSNHAPPTAQWDYWGESTAVVAAIVEAGRKLVNGQRGERGAE